MSQPLRYGAAILVLAALVAGLGWAFQAKLAQRRERTQRLAALPPLQAFRLDGTAFLPLTEATGPLVLIYFEPDCDHCQRQATEVSNHATEFGAARLLWLSKDSLPALRQFAQRYGLSRQPMMQVAKIRPEVAQKLGLFSVPDIRIYGPDRKLIRRYRGETSAAAISRAL